MKTKLLMMSVLLIGCLQSQVVIFSDSFENPTVVNGAYRPSGWSWTALNNVGIVENNNTTGFNLPSGLVQDGNQAALIQEIGSISHDISLTGGFGNTYSLSFYYAGRASTGAGGPAPNTGNQSFQISLDGVVIYSGASTTDQNWTFVTTDFVRTAGTYNLKLEGLATTDQTAFFDNLAVTASAVPEPKTPLFGFCILLGFICLFKKKNILTALK